jgi:tetratricopeptide (TPR) repeat protein
LGADLSADYATEGNGSSSYFYKPRPAGRAGVLTALLSKLEQSKSGRGALVLIAGESGSGKTFLAAEIGRRARRNRATIVSGECLPIGYGMVQEERSSAPFAPLIPMFRLLADRCRAGGIEMTRRLLGARAKLLARYEPTMAHVPGFEDYPEPPEATPEMARERLLTAVRESVIALSSERQVLWLIDDLQWADELTLNLLTSPEWRFFDGLKLLIVGTYRSDEMTTGLYTLLRGQAHEAIQLTPLVDEDVEAMVADMLAVRAPPKRLVKLLTKHSQGNPFFVAEYLRAAADVHLLVRDGQHWQLRAPQSETGVGDTEDAELPLPPSVRDLVSRRIETLPPKCRPVLGAAAVLGRELDPERLVAMVGDPEETLEAVALLREHQVLQGEDGRLTFVHDQIAALVYSNLSDTASRSLHARAAQVLESRIDEDPPSLRLAIAHHWSTSGNPSRAALHLHQAARHARDSWANQEAVRLYEQALLEAIAAHGDVDQPTLIPAQEELGDLLTMMGDTSSASRHYEEALIRAQHPLLRARLHRKHGHALSAERHYDSAVTALAAAGTTLESSGVRSQAWWQEWIEIQNESIWIRYWTGAPNDLSALLGLVERVRLPTESHGTPAQRTRFHYMLSLAALKRDRYRSVEGLTHARISAQAAVETDGFLRSAEARFHLGFVLSTCNDPREGEKTLADVVQEAGRLGYAHLGVRAQAYLSVAQRRLRKPAGLEAAAMTIAMAEAHNMPHYAAVGQANRGWYAMTNGDLDLAEEHLRRALRIWRSNRPDIYPFQWLAGLPFAVLILRRGLPNDELAGVIANMDDASQQLMPAEVADAFEAVTRMTSTERPHLVAILEAASASYHPI